MKYCYPAIFLKERDGYAVQFPDFVDCWTQGKTLSEALSMAEMTLNITLYFLEEYQKAPPRPYSEQWEGEIYDITCDTAEYRKELDDRSTWKAGFLLY